MSEKKVNSSIHCCVIQAVVPDYRIGFFETLNSIKPMKLVFGDYYFTKTVVSDQRAVNIGQAVVAENKYLLGRRALLQTWPGMLKDLLSEQIRVIELNPRCFVSWFSLMSSFLLRRGKTVVWGHRLNRNGDESKLSLRSVMMALANGVIFYTKGQKDSFSKTTLGKHIPSGFAPNSVLYKKQIFNMPQAGSDFIYVGRLVDDKKPLLLIEAFIAAKVSKGSNFKSTLHVIGDGSCFEKAKLLIDLHDAGGFVTLHGHQSDYEYLKNIYSGCVASVSPGYVGLSITQSFSFGKPMIIAENEPHSPEIECFKDSINGSFFESDSVESLAEKIINFYDQRNEWSARSSDISKDISENYTYEAMAAGFYRLINEVQGEK